MLDRILTASRTVERPTPKICINSGSGGSFSPTSNFPDMNCPCNRPASSSASDFLLSCMFEPGFIISSDVLREGINSEPAKFSGIFCVRKKVRARKLHPL